MFYVNFNTGAGNYKSDLELPKLMEDVEQNLSYTQATVTIEDENGNEVAWLPWYGVEPEDEDAVTARFGNFGYYGEWQANE